VTKGFGFVSSLRVARRRRERFFRFAAFGRILGFRLFARSFSGVETRRTGMAGRGDGHLRRKRLIAGHLFETLDVGTVKGENDLYFENGIGVVGQLAS
jgi:hypothetical protein